MRTCSFALDYRSECQNSRPLGHSTCPRSALCDRLSPTQS